MLGSGYDLNSLLGMLYCIPTSGLTYEILRQVYTMMGWDARNILYVPGVSCLEMNEYVADYAAGGVKWKENDQVVGLFDEVLKRLPDYDDPASPVDADDTPVEHLFDYCISNPPYQHQTGVKKDGSPVSSAIYDKFHYHAASFSHTISMIYPSTWTKNTNSELYKWLIAHGLHTVSVHKSPDVFGGSVEASLNVSVVNTVSGYEGDITSNGVVFDRNSEIWVRSVVDKILAEKVICRNSLIDMKHLTTYANVESSGVKFTRDEEQCDTPVRFLIKADSSFSGRLEWFHAEKEEVIDDIDSTLLDKHNVVIPQSYFLRSTMFNRPYNKHSYYNVEILPPGATAGKTLMHVASFDTGEEAGNFVKYFQSWIITVIASMDSSRKNFGKLIPDLGDYTSNNPNIDWCEPVEPQLYELFGLDDKEQAIIEEGV